jgi:hypothetical protein
MRTAFETDVQREVIRADQGDNFHQAFPFPIWCGWIAPYLRNVGGQPKNCSTLFLVEELSILRALLFTSLLCFCRQPQLVIPVRLRGIGYQAVIRINTEIAAPGEIGFIACPIH